MIKLIFKSLYYLLFCGWGQEHYLTEDEIRRAGVEPATFSNPPPSVFNQGGHHHHHHRW